jgi:nicotinate phosphoribosyltransferase
LRIDAPLIQAQLLETALLTILNFQSLVATKAARVVDAAQGDTILEFGLRRAQGVDGGLAASRAAYIGGVDATSNVLAGKLFDIPVRGTHAHSWVMAFDTEREAFRKYADTMPNNCVFLVDTYDTVEGVKTAIEIGQELRQQGYKLQGIRLDSGNLAELSRTARELLDAAGFEDANIVASDDLNEYRIAELKDQKAAINVWGVGTQLVTAYDQPALGGVYKLAALFEPQTQTWKHKIKLSENPIKVSTPGILQLRRFYLTDGQPFGDMIWNTQDEAPKTELIECFDSRTVVANERHYEDLLVPIFADGELIYTAPTIHQSRDRARSQVATYRKVNFNLYPVGLEQSLQALKLQLINNRKK